MTASSSTQVTVMTTPWCVAAGGVTARLARDLGQVNGALSHQPRYRFAAVSPDDPGAWTTFGTVVAAGAPASSVDDKSLTGTTDQMFVQLGLGASSASAGDVLARLVASVRANGFLVASGTVDVGATVNSTSSGTFEVGRPFPALGLTGLMFAFTVSGVTGASLTGQAVVRPITADPDEPSAWLTPGGAGGAFTVSTGTANARQNSGTLTMPGSWPTSPLPTFAQAGLTLTGGGASGRVGVLVAALYA